MIRSVLFLLIALACLLPAVGAGPALAVGIAFALIAGNPWPKRTTRVSKLLLQVSVVGLGFGLGIGQVWQAGRSGILYTMVGITATLLMGWGLGRLMRIRPGTAQLISFGTAICGGSAIAALAPVLEAEDEEIAVSLATVFTLNAVALFLFPLIGHALDLSQSQFGLWAALAIHDTSSVVGAGAAYGAAALTIATTVKLARAAWIAPVTLAFSWARRSKRKVAVPWFIFGFLAAASLRTLLPAADTAWDGLYTLARRVLVLTLFLIGAGLSRAVLRNVGIRALAMATSLWILVGGLTLLLIRNDWIG